MQASLDVSRSRICLGVWSIWEQPQDQYCFGVREAAHITTGFPFAAEQTHHMGIIHDPFSSLRNTNTCDNPIIPMQSYGTNWAHNPRYCCRFQACRGLLDGSVSLFRNDKSSFDCYGKDYS